MLLILIATFILGTIVGSFLNVVIWRLPREQSLGGRSKCPHCSHVLHPRDLIPLFSYFVYNKRCAYCKAKISPRYFIIEFITGLLFASAAYFILIPEVSPSHIFDWLRTAFILSILLVVFVIDLEHYLILDKVVFPAIIVMVILNIILDLTYGIFPVSLLSFTADGLAAALLAGGFFYFVWIISRGRWMGFGDVKFVLFLGLALGTAGIIVGLFLSFMIGAVVGVILLALQLKQLQSKVPFGTFLSIGAIIALFCSPEIAQWYLRLIGWS